MNQPTFLVIDLFCGFGGTTLGYELALLEGEQVAKVLACVNHDPKAIKSHWMNHENVLHFEEDIRVLELSPLVEIVRKARVQFPDAYVVLWASLECTNHSKAKGGLPRDGDSRTLANDLFRYQEALDPDYIKIENVVEFMAWGPLDENQKPISRKNGRDWVRWRKEMCSRGYFDEWKELNSANFGAYTSRNRLFGCFAKHGLPIVWPTPTHSKVVLRQEALRQAQGDNAMFGHLKPWKAVKDVLNFEDEGESIFGRKIPLVDKTLERIYAGLVKYVAGGEKAFFTKYMGNNAETGINNGKSLEEPCPVIATSNRLGLVQTNFIAQRNSGNPKGKVFSTEGPARTLTCTGGNQELVQPAFIAKYFSGKPETLVIPVTGPAGTITCKDGQALVQPTFLVNFQHSSDAVSVENPSPTLLTRDKLALAQPCFLYKYFGKGTNIQSVDDPCGTLTTKDRFANVKPCFLDKQYGSGADNHQSVEDPAGSLTANPKLNLVTTDPFLVNQNFDNGPKSIEDPLGVITANRKWFYLVNPQYSWPASSVEKPAFTLIARMDKMPPYLVALDGGRIGIEVFESDTPICRKIKEFMALYGLADIKMRMLRVPELLRIQGFPDTYQMAGNQSDHKKFIGNSVVPHVVKAWVEAMSYKLKIKSWHDGRTGTMSA